MRKLEERLLRFPEELLIEAAREAAADAISHRDYHVGAVVLAENPDTGQICAFPGANWKPVSHGLKYCAEGDAISKALKAGYSRILLIVVAADQQPDDESRVVAPTAHPCGGCRRNLRGIPGIERVLFVTVRRDSDVVERFTFNELWERHNGNSH